MKYALGITAIIAIAQTPAIVQLLAMVLIATIYGVAVSVTQPRG